MITETITFEDGRTFEIGVKLEPREFILEAEIVKDIIRFIPPSTPEPDYTILNNGCKSCGANEFKKINKREYNCSYCKQSTFI